ncbi:MAG: phosphoribosylaminoimidazolesuccinocarboxamide synthase [Candidatus Latescibacteria bacterium]|jgi:phosphoribosylaminoimidazole-succinocarboxamide synthase|nr:phosphoribosylaminoimidazolesuccinocarboxamide synthase [Candidatus Latescibacterota bacterium]MBT4139432.1 phosphoribosylaminoimidazolesuccinocarboxamide synthase [Candidatus Latescibacterota bacterium]MBT5830201.1 phosphoribosylaminoimidazolesuccinocarboxamide synthase [Candidatus Latescibacterota bacterium]
MVTDAQIRSQLDNCLLDAKFDRWADSYQKGKVRDMYVLDGKRILITTDRQSAFDHVLGAIPLKGQVLNRIALHWFEKTKDIMPNQVVAVPDPNVTVARELTIVPVEVVVRRYLTGSTDTSIWTNYAKGVRKFCGVDLPDGMVKNQKLESAIITPTTKAEDHDASISAVEIVERGLVDADRWAEVEEKALALFARGTEIAAERGLVLVDTKYEMGVDENGILTIADEIHTPDSSRYWVSDSYEERHKNGEEPESLDKEFLRLWLRDKGISDTNIPELDDDIRTQVSARYIDLFERVTGLSFDPEIGDAPVAERIEKNIEQYF